MSKEEKSGESLAKLPAILTPMALAKSPGVSKVFILTPEILKKLGLPGHLTTRIASRDADVKTLDSPSPSQGFLEKSDENSIKPSNTIKLVVDAVAGSTKRKRESTSEQNPAKTMGTLKTRVPEQSEEQLKALYPKLTVKEENSKDDIRCAPKTKKRKRDSNIQDSVQPQNVNPESANESKNEEDKSPINVRTSKRVIKFKKFDDYICTDNVLSFGAGSSNAAEKVKNRRSSTNINKTDLVEQQHSTINIKNVAKNEDDNKRGVNRINSEQKDSKTKRKISSEDIHLKLPDSHNDFDKKETSKIHGKKKPKEKQPVIQIAQETKEKLQEKANANPVISELKKSKNTSQMKSRKPVRNKLAETKVSLSESEIGNSSLDTSDSRKNSSSERICDDSTQQMSDAGETKLKNVIGKTKTKEKSISERIELNEVTNSRELIDDSKIKFSKRANYPEKISGVVGKKKVSHGKEVNRTQDDRITTEIDQRRSDKEFNEEKGKIVVEQDSNTEPKIFKSLQINPAGNESTLEIPKTSSESTDGIMPDSIAPKLLLGNKVEIDSKPKILKLLQINKDGSNAKPKIVKILQLNKDGNNTKPKILKILPINNAGGKPKIVKILQIQKEGSVSNFKIPKISRQSEEKPSTSTTLPVLPEHAETNDSKPRIAERFLEKDETKSTSGESQWMPEQNVDLEPVPLLLPDNIEETRNVICNSPILVDSLKSNSSNCLNTETESPSKSLDNNIDYSILELNSEMCVGKKTRKEKSHLKSNNEETYISITSAKNILRNEKPIVPSRKPSRKDERDSESAKSVREDEKIVALEFESSIITKHKETVLVSDVELDLTADEKETVFVSDVKSPNKEKNVIVANLELPESSSLIENVIVAPLESPEYIGENADDIAPKLKSPQFLCMNEETAVLQLESSQSSCTNDKTAASQLKSTQSPPTNDETVASEIESTESNDEDVGSQLRLLQSNEEADASQLQLPQSNEEAVASQSESPQISCINEETTLSQFKSQQSEIESTESNDEVVTSQLQKPQSKEETFASQSELQKLSCINEETAVSQLKSTQFPRSNEETIASQMESTESNKEAVTSQFKSPQLNEETVTSQLQEPQPNEEAVSSQMQKLQSNEETFASQLELPKLSCINEETALSQLKSTQFPRSNEETVASQMESTESNEEAVTSKLQVPQSNEEAVTSQLQSPESDEEADASQVESPKRSCVNEETAVSQLKLQQSPDTNAETIASQIESTESNDEAVGSKLQSLQSNEEAVASQLQSLQSNEEAVNSQLQSPQTNEETFASQLELPKLSCINEETPVSQLKLQQSPDKNEETIASQIESTESNDEVIGSQLQSLQSNEEATASQLQSLQSNEEAVASQLESPKLSCINEEIVISHLESPQICNKGDETSELPSLQSSEGEVFTSKLLMTQSEKEEITNSEPLVDESRTTRNKSNKKVDAKIRRSIRNKRKVNNINNTLTNDSSNVEPIKVEISPAGKIPDATDSQSEEPPIRRRRGRPKKVVLPILENDLEPNLDRKEILGIKSIDETPSIQQLADESRTPTRRNKIPKNVEISLPNDSEIIQDIETSVSSIANVTESQLKEQVVPRKRGRPRKSVLPITENDFKPNLEKEETPVIESVKSPALENPVINSTGRTIRPPQRHMYETEWKAVSEGSEGNAETEASETDDSTFEVTPVRRRGRPPGVMSKGWTGGRRNKKNQRRGFGRRRGGRGGAKNRSDCLPEVETKTDNQNEAESCAQLDEPKQNLPVVGGVECGKCKNQMPKKDWNKHNINIHNGMSWRAGTEEPDFENDIKLFRSILMATLKKKHTLTCETCGVAKRSANGFISHLQFCGKTDEERASLLVTCPICNNVMMPSSWEPHERSHRQVEKSENEKKWEEAIGPQDPSARKVKRKAAEKAATNISKFTELVRDDPDEVKKKNENEVTAMIKKPQSPYNPPKVWRGMWKNELIANKKALCRHAGCQFSGNSLEIMYEHNAICPFTPIATYVCKVCSFSSLNKQTVENHVRDKHWDGNSYADSDSKEESSSSEDFSDGDDELQTRLRSPKKDLNYDRYRPQSTGVKYLDDETQIHPKWPVCYPPSIRWTMEFEVKNYRMRLFENLTPRSMNLMEYDKSLEYLPELSQSIRVKVPGKNANKDATNWVRWDRFQGRVIKGVPSFFTGGPVWAMAWLPISASMYDSNPNQYIAVSTHRSMEADDNVCVGKSSTGKNMIQIWNVGHLDHSKKASLQAPEFAYGVTHDKGMIWCMEWCPSGCYEHENLPDSLTNATTSNENTKKRMGLLAAACSDGCVHIFSLPFPEDLKFTKTDEDPPDLRPIYDTKPVLTLTLSRSQYEKGEQNFQCTSINWSKHLGHDRVIAGFTNGVVGLWDLTPSNPSLVHSNGETTIIEGFHNFIAHHHAVSSVHIDPTSEDQYFYTTSYDRLTKLWDKRDLEEPVEIAKRGIITTAALLSHWNVLVTGSDDAYGLANSHSYIVSLRQPDNRALPVLPTKSTIYGVAVSDYGNSIGQGTVSGEVLVMFPHQLWSFRDMDRDLPKKRWLASVTKIVDFEAPEKQKGVKTGVKRTTKETEYEFKPETYKGCDDRYGIWFHDELTRSQQDIRARHPKQSCTNRLSTFNIEQYTFVSVNRLSWNPNAWSYLWLCTGYQNGFVRLLNFNSVALDKELGKLLPTHAKSMLRGETSDADVEEDIDEASQMDIETESL